MLWDRVVRYVTGAPVPGELLYMRDFGASCPLWKTGEGHGVMGRVPSGSLLVALGDVTDTHIRVLAPSGTVGWIHRNYTVGHPPPGLIAFTVKALAQPARRVMILAGAFLFGAEILGVSSPRDIATPPSHPPRAPEETPPGRAGGQ